MLFRRLDQTLWRSTHHNPVRILTETSPGVLDQRAEDPHFLELYDSTLKRFHDYMSDRKTWFNRSVARPPDQPIAYFCAEFAIHNSVPIYSGGLGLLAGDTCKEASDLGIPFVGVGFFYPEGFFRQRIESDGVQEAVYQRLDPNKAPLLPVLNDDGSRLLSSVPVGNRNIQLIVWKIQVGRVPLYLMDTNIPENAPQDRHLSMRLYIGDSHLRLHQEIILGIGGVRVLRALGYEPGVFHLNEGHAALAGFEFMRELGASGSNFDEALEQVREQTVFTTHTPVVAGHDRFPISLVEESLSGFRQELPFDLHQCLDLGRSDQDFSMSVLAFRLARLANAVSKRHCEVSRGMWHYLWPDRPLEEVPVFAITNGVHVPTWVAPQMAELLQEYVGPNWLEEHDDPSIWDRVLDIPDELLWRTHLELKGRLFNLMRERARRQWVDDHRNPGQILATGALFQPDALTIGFARRFATYKRATLILSERQRLRRLLQNPWRPVQVVFAGKAHPDDGPGKDKLREVFQACLSPDFGGRLAFVEEFDKHIAHFLVAGVDIWLNNPRPPQEASGTSGQKSAINAVPSLSVLDGWWVEGYNGKNGWAVDESPGAEDSIAATRIYKLLEEDIVPTFYDVDPDGVPRRWVQIMKEALRSNAARFSARRMLKEYFQKLYSVPGRELVP